MIRKFLSLDNRIGTLIFLTTLNLVVSSEEPIRVADISPAQNDGHPIDPALEIARQSLLHAQLNICDYTGLFVKRCRVDGVLPPLQYAKIKIRERKIENGMVTTPMGVYLDFLKPADVAGREVIWLEGANDGNMLVHQGGLARFITLTLAPDGYLAMRGQRYPITDVGIENLLRKIIETAERDRQFGECDVQIFRTAKVGEIECTMVQLTHPVPRPHFDFYRAQVFFSNELNVPIRYKSWGWPESAGAEPPVQDEYNYLRLELNVGLTDHDFDSSNPAYRYR